MSTMIDPVAPRRSGRRALLVIAAVVAVLALVLVGGALAYAKNFDGRALPGTTLLGADVSGRSAGEIEKLVTDRAGAAKVTVTAGDVTRTVPLSDVGVTVDAKATAARAIEHGGGSLETLRSVVDGSHPVSPVVKVDRGVIATFASSLVPDDRQAAADAQVAYDKDSDTWSVVPARAGEGVDVRALADGIEKKAPSLASFSISQPVSQTQPQLTDDMARSTLDTIQSALDQPMTITAPDGTKVDVPKKTRSSWLAVGPTEDRDGFAVTVDEKAVSEWVSGKAEKAGIDPVDGIEQVDAAGTTVKVLSEKKDGTKITNAPAVAEQLVKGLTDGTSVEAAFEATPVAATVKKAKAPQAAPADPAASPAPADPATAAAPASGGDKWIDVDLTNKTVTAYEGENPVWGPVKIVDGKDGKTKPGTYKIWYRTEKQDMTNGTRGVATSDPDYYYTKDVPWVQYFDGNIAFHGAPWRSSFGYSGSHGCINMRVSDAKRLWDFASIGTKVVVHE